MYAYSFYTYTIGHGNFMYTKYFLIKSTSGKTICDPHLCKQTTVNSLQKQFFMYIVTIYIYPIIYDNCMYTKQFFEVFNSGLLLQTKSHVLFKPFFQFLHLHTLFFS